MAKSDVKTFDQAKTSLGIKGSLFEEAKGESKQRIIMAMDAEEKCGKTHFALTSPGTIAYFNLDQGLDSVIQKFQKKKRVLVASLTLPKKGSGLDQDDVANAARDSWGKFVDTFVIAVKEKEVRTIVIDTATELWELLRLACFGKLTQVMPHNYATPNAIYREMIREVENTDKNLILIHKVTNEYVNDKTTGNKVRAGYKDSGYIVQVNARLWKVPDEDFPDRFHMKITDCRMNPEVEGLELTGEGSSFPMLAQMIFPDTTEEDWL